MASYRSTGSEEWRIVLIGKTGAGKSSAGNTILGREAFEAEPSAESVTSYCQKERGEVGGKNIAVVDTPGMFDTTLTHKEAWDRIKVCIGMTSPGPHAVLVIVKVGRITEEEKQTVKMIQEGFGEDAARYTMVLFTYGDLLRKQTIQQFVSKSKDLQDLIQKCYGRYHVFNNMADNASQVRELLQKIDVMMEENGRSYYTTQMFQKAEEEIEKEKARILKESEAKRKKEEEALRAKYQGELLKKQQEEKRRRDEAEARARAEKENEEGPSCCVIA